MCGCVFLLQKYPSPKLWNKLETPWIHFGTAWTTLGHHHLENDALYYTLYFALHHAMYHALEYAWNYALHSKLWDHIMTT